MSRPQGIELTDDHRAIIIKAIGDEETKSVAARIGVEKNSLYLVLNGRRRPSRAMLDKLCDAVGLEWRYEIVIKKRPRNKAQTSTE